MVALAEEFVRGHLGHAQVAEVPEAGPAASLPRARAWLGLGLGLGFGFGLGLGLRLGLGLPAPPSPAPKPKPSSLGISASMFGVREPRELPHSRE